MIYPCNYTQLRDLVFSTIYAPIPRTLTIILKNENAAEKLGDIIFDLTKIQPKKWRSNAFYTSFVGENGGQIKIYYFENSRFILGFRTNDIIADEEFPLVDFYETYMPMCNLLGRGDTYSIKSYDIYSWKANEHQKGMEEIEYWRKVRKEDGRQIN